VSDPLAPAVFWSNVTADGPECVRHGHEDFWVWRLRAATSNRPEARKVWAGYRVKGPLGETEHRVAEDTDVRQVVALHLLDPATQKRATELQGELIALKFKPIETVASKDVELIGVHGVADPRRVSMVIHPADATLLASLAARNVFLLTDDGRVIDVAAHQWPIDVDRVSDYRSKLLAPVKFGDRLGVVAACMGDVVIVKAEREIPVPIHDLDPVMVDRSYRLLIGGE